MRCSLEEESFLLLKYLSSLIKLFKYIMERFVLKREGKNLPAEHGSVSFLFLPICHKQSALSLFKIFECLKIFPCWYLFFQSLPRPYRSLPKSYYAGPTAKSLSSENHSGFCLSNFFCNKLLLINHFLLHVCFQIF